MKSVKSINPFKSVPVPYSSGIQTSYDIVKAHGGEIKLESQSAAAAAEQLGMEEQGTTFLNVLPC